ncbi:MAG: SDR family NAD(P)-dependent oxidoreductase, partial [Actinobacteria bacterium]|nr:SDR family NAD(P)-dependent oxidoreductase [Actinomycetota bacterium]
MITPADVSLEGQVAIVTGGARGIGRAIALGLAAFGAEVAVCDRDAANQAETVEQLEALG